MVIIIPLIWQVGAMRYIIMYPYKEKDDIVIKDEDTSDKLFVDEEFGTNESTLGNIENLNYKNVSWIRATDLQPQCSDMVLFHGVEPNDIVQGGLGDCWFLCRATLAEFPNYLKNTIFKTDHVSPNGKYELQFYNISTKVWDTVVIDDFIPCGPKRWFDIQRPLFAQPNENEMYVLLLEKALAKLSGSYTDDYLEGILY